MNIEECEHEKHRLVQDFHEKFCEDNQVVCENTVKVNEQGQQKATNNGNRQYDNNSLTIVKDSDTKTCDGSQRKKEQLKSEENNTSLEYTGEATEYEEGLHPLSERWSPLGANYDDTMSPTSDLLSPESEIEMFGADDQDKRFKNLEEEQEQLTSSLMALTSHFAHVQLRVRQIVEAPTHERDQLLKDLEEFAFRGIPDPLSPCAAETPNSDPSTVSHFDEETTRQRQFELIEHLKAQLSELENYAYDSGAPVLPQHILLQKQKIIIDELKNKLNLKVEDQDLPELTTEELKNQVDNAIGEFVGPLKMKDQLVAQLKTQITDLERFIAFLQCDSDDSKLKSMGTSEKLTEVYNSYAAKKKGSHKNTSPISSQAPISSLSPSLSGRSPTQNQKESLNSKAHGLIDRASLLMQMFASTHFGTSANSFQKNTLKKTSKGNHWGDLRAQLEVDIQEVAALAATLSFDKEKLANMKRTLKKKSITCNDTLSAKSVLLQTRANRKVGHHCTDPQNDDLKIYAGTSDSDDEYECYDWEKFRKRVAHNSRYSNDSINMISKELTTAVRKNFAVTLQRLIQHGLRAETESATSSLIVPFMRCLNPTPVFAGSVAHNNRARAPSAFTASSLYQGSDNDRSSSGFFSSEASRQMHAWELILEYYYLKNGDEYNNTPARKLSQSFNLDIVNSKAVSAKQNLLSAIGMIIAMHQPYKRSYNAHFKAFISIALNSHKLVEWLNLIFSCNDLIDTYYTQSSYVARTGFRDSLHSIDTLSKYDFDLPVDLAVRHFQNI